MGAPRGRNENSRMAVIEKSPKGRWVRALYRWMDDEWVVDEEVDVHEEVLQSMREGEDLGRFLHGGAVPGEDV